MATISRTDLLRWSQSLKAVAQTGLSFTQSLYERERFEEILKIAADIGAVLNGADADELEIAEVPDELYENWRKDTGEGVSGYVTPKVAVGAIVGNEKNEILLIKRADSGIWLYPTGWADVGYSPAEIVVKEVREETGIIVKPERLIGILDGLRFGNPRFAFYSILFHCSYVEGDLKAHPLEVLDLGWFSQDNLPQPLAGHKLLMDLAFRAIKNEPIEAFFDLPRDPLWRS